jgi:hypothetical protein
MFSLHHDWASKESGTPLQPIFRRVLKCWIALFSLGVSECIQIWTDFEEILYISILNVDFNPLRSDSFPNKRRWKFLQCFFLFKLFADFGNSKRPTALTFIVAFLSSSGQMLTQYLKMSNDRFLPHPDQFINHSHSIIRRFLTYAAEKADLPKPRNTKKKSIPGPRKVGTLSSPTRPNVCLILCVPRSPSTGLRRPQSETVERWSHRCHDPSESPCLYQLFR